MKKLFFILFLIALSLSAIGQQNMPSVGYRFYGWAGVGLGNSSTLIPNSQIAFYIGRSGGNQGLFLHPQDTSLFINPPQGLIVSFASDSNRLYQYNGVKWERLGGGISGPIGPFENPLTFSNGLTRAGNGIKWGGTLNVNTVVDGANNYNVVFANLKFGVNVSSPQYGIDVNTARINTLPYIQRSDTTLTYDPNTKQVGYTTRKTCLDSIINIFLSVGTDIPNGDSSYVNSSLIGKKVKIHREGEEIYTSATEGYQFNNNTGTVVFHPWLNFRERISIDYVCDPSYVGGVPNAIITNNSLYIITNTGQYIIIN